MHQDKKLLLIMRHAKSDQTLCGTDFDRTLNARGHHEPQQIAHQLNELAIDIDIALVSTAKRTIETWELLKQHLKNPPSKIFFEQRLYNAYYEDVIDVAADFATDASRLLIIAHNPSVTEACSALSQQNYEFSPADLAILSTHSETLLMAIKNRQFHLERVLSAHQR